MLLYFPNETKKVKCLCFCATTEKLSVSLLCWEMSICRVVCGGDSLRDYISHIVTGVWISSSHHHTTPCLIDHWWRLGLLDCSTVCVFVCVCVWVCVCVCVCLGVGVHCVYRCQCGCMCDCARLNVWVCVCVLKCAV